MTTLIADSFEQLLRTFPRQKIVAETDPAYSDAEGFGGCVTCASGQPCQTHIRAAGPMRQLFEAFRKQVLALDPCVTEEFLKLYVAYKAETNFVDVVPQKSRLRLALNMSFYIEQYSVNFRDAIASVNEELDEFGLTSFDVENAEERSQAVAATIGVGLKWLKSDAQYGRTQVNEAARFLELAIFPEDTLIPIRTLALLWQQTGNLTIALTERLCRRLADLALILRYDPQGQTILLHDVTRHYLISQAPLEQLGLWHSTLLDGYQMQCGGDCQMTNMSINIYCIICRKRSSKTRLKTYYSPTIGLTQSCRQQIL